MQEYHDPLVEPFMRRLKEAAPDLTEEQLRDIRRTASAPRGSQDCVPATRKTKPPGRR